MRLARVLYAVDNSDKHKRAWRRKYNRERYAQETAHLVNCKGSREEAQFTNGQGQVICHVCREMFTVTTDGLIYTHKARRWRKEPKS